MRGDCRQSDEYYRRAVTNKERLLDAKCPNAALRGGGCLQGSNAGENLEESMGDQTKGLEQRLKANEAETKKFKNDFAEE